MSAAARCHTAGKSSPGWNSVPAPGGAVQYNKWRTRQAEQDATVREVWSILEPEFLVTPKFRVLLRIRSNWAKHSEFTPKFGAPRLGQHFCSLNGLKILSRSWDMTKWRYLQKTLSARTNFVQNVVQNYRGHNLILNFQGHLETKVQNFLIVGI